MSERLLTTKEVAERLGITYSRVRQLIRGGVLQAQHLGHIYVVKESDLKAATARETKRGPKPKPTPDAPEKKAKR